MAGPAALRAMTAWAGPVVFLSLGFLAGKWESPRPTFPAMRGCDGRHPHITAADGQLPWVTVTLTLAAYITLPNWL